jgi:hypothetical protein
VLETVPAADLTDIDRGRLTFQRAVNRLFTLADPAGAKKFIDAASAAIGPQGRFCVDAFLAVYWAAMGQPQKVSDVAQTFAWDELPDAIAQRMTAWALAGRVALGAGRLDEACSRLGIVVDELFASGETNGWDYRCQILHTQALALRGSTRDACDAFAVLESNATPVASTSITSMRSRGHG